MMKRFLLLLTLAASLCACSTAARFYRGPESREIEEMPAYGGTIEAVYYPSSEKHVTQRRMVVYLPKDYYKDTLRRYPVLYLLHGARGNEKTWIDSADVFRRLDSLRTEGLAKDFILVMPNMNRYHNDKDYSNSRCLRALPAFWTVDGEVERYFVDDVVRFTQQHYRTIERKYARAIAGMSNGGLQAIYLSADYPRAFDYVGLFSPYAKAMAGKFHRDVYSGLRWKQKEQFSDPPKLYVLYTADKDFFYHHMKALEKRMVRSGFQHEFVVNPGGHEWYNWIANFEDFVQRIF